MTAAERVVLLAVNLDDARFWIRRQQLAPVAIVTVRSQATVRGITADRVQETPAAAKHPRIQELRNVAAPALATTSPEGLTA